MDALESNIEAGTEVEAVLPLRTASTLAPPRLIFSASALKQVANAKAGTTSPAEKEPDRNLAPCPQGSDCAGESAPTRLFDCDHGCGFCGCAACMQIHQDEPHVSDSDNMLAMVREIGG